MKIFSLFQKTKRTDILESKASAIVGSLTKDSNKFTPIEQAAILKRVNNIILSHFTEGYNAAYATQQNILEAKEIIK